MFKNKLDVDRHVESCLKCLNSELERNLRSFAIAKLYFGVNEYELARRYVSNYLTVKPNSSEAHLLLGKILEKLGRREAALEAYRTSLDLDPKQRNLILKVCELLTSSDNVDMELSRARYWCEQAQLIDPKNPVVFNLRERLLASEKISPDDIRKLFIFELEHRPTDVDLRVRLLKHLLENNQITDAYKHVADIEQKNLPIFANHYAWYETVAQILIRYKNDNLNDNKVLHHEFWMLIISVLDKLVSLCLSEHLTSTKKDQNECINAVSNLDQTLTIAAKNINSDRIEKQVSEQFLIHYRAQLCFHIATLAFKQAKKDQINYKEAINQSLPLLLISYHSQPVEMQCVWLDHVSEQVRKQMQRLNREASFRCSQAGHILLALAKDRRSTFVDRIEQLCNGPWREKIYKNTFITRDLQMKMKTSYFVSCPQLDQVTIRLPDSTELLRYDEVAQLMYPDSMHHLIWIGLNTQPVSKFKCTIFEGLQYSCRNLSNYTAESLNILDIQAFLYCCIFCAQSHLEESKHNIVYICNQDKPNVLPTSITDPLGTLTQSKWFSSAYRMFRNESGSNMSDARVTLMKGIEIVRCAGAHGLDVKLLIMLANTFAQKAKCEMVKPSELELIEARAELYWKTALPMLEKLRNNQTLTYPVKRWFEYRGREMLSPTEINMHIEDGKLFSALQLMKKKEHEKVLEMLNSVKSPYASFYQAQTYQLLADEQLLSHNSENVTSEMRSQYIILLSKARDCFYLTLDRLREPSVDRKHPLNAELGTEIEKIERLLSRIDPDCVNRNECCDGISDENVTSDESEHVYPNNNNSKLLLSTPSYRNLNNHSLNRSSRRRIEARPSPERLDAQLRQMAAAKDAYLAQILEQQKLILEANRSLIDEVRELKMSVDELKHSVSDLQGMKEKLEIINDIKNDIADLKKDSATKLTNSQINEEDLYAFEEDYGVVDYNIANNSGFNSAALYHQNFPQRLPNANPLPFAGAASLYGMYPMYPPYGALAQPAALPFPDGHVLDFRSMGSIGQGLAQAATINQPIQTFPAPTTNIVKSPATMTAAPPVNVVITTSDPLPTTTSVVVSQPSILSVTIPPQHLKSNQQQKSQPHNYQIALPSQPTMTVPKSISTTTTAPTSLYSPLTFKSPVQTTSKGLGLQIEKSLSESFASSDVSKTSIEEHDPYPDFKPIIPLPDEVPVTTGEENETVLFCEHAKLFRFVEKEWRERGTGNVKLLHNTETNKIRILMRRDQVHKICMNHFLSPDLVLTPMPKSDERAYIWAANDYADGKLVVEKLCIRFKTAEQGKRFLNAFENAKTMLVNKTPKKDGNNTLGGFVFTSNPTFKPKSVEETKQTPVSAAIATTVLPISTNKDSPFSSFSFGVKNSNSTPVQTEKLSTSIQGNEQHEEDDFVPTVDFKPVVPLPDLVEVKTGEEHCTILFEVKAKLLRFDSELKEWKERGVGIMKILKDQTTIRLLMRREQVHKVCCNHQLLKGMIFTNMPTNNKVLNWCAQDFSENVLKLEMFAIRFRTAELCEEFLKTIQNAQDMLDSSSNIITATPDEMGASKIMWGDKHKPKEVAAGNCWDCPVCNANNKKTEKCVSCGSEKSSLSSDSAQSPQKFKPSPAIPAIQSKPKPTAWLCKVCYIHNDGKRSYCEACDTPKNDSIPKRAGDASGQQFSFGVIAQTNVDDKQKLPATASWGDAFKSKPGEWECKFCYIKNTPEGLHCIACESPKDNTVPKKETKGIDLGGQKFTFGVQEAAAVGTKVDDKQKQPASAGWGEAFKSKPGEWECKFCYIKNTPESLHCIACESPKDNTVPKKEAKGLDLAGQKFTFGIQTPPTAATTTTEPIFGSKVQPPITGFTFGMPTKPSTTTTSFTFGQTTVSESTPPNFNSFSFSAQNEPQTASDAEFIFGSPQKHDFDFKPRSPRKISGGDGESDTSEAEEECDNIYFKPIIPLPDKVPVRTGEEDENVLYCQRAKLFRFCAGEWKERGLGDIKILKHKITGKLRVVMRREQVLKICLNHALTNDVEYTAKDERTWLFSVADFSDGEINYQQFCVRFKNAEFAQLFIDAVKEALNNDGTTTTTETKSSENSDSDVEIVYELKVTPEEEAKALALQLPKNFYAYLQKPPCKGCIGCNDENFVFKSESSELKKQLEKSNPVSPLSTFSFSVPITSSSNVTTTSSSAIIKSPTLTSLLTNNVPPQNTTIFGGKPITTTTVTSKPKEFSSIFSGGKTLFGNIQPLNATKTETTSLSTFGGTSSNLFGGMTTTTAATTHVFGSGSIWSSKLTSDPPATTTSAFNMPAKPFSGGSIFSQAATNETTTTKPSIFGNLSSTSTSSPPTFSSLATSVKSNDNPILTFNSNLSFSALASEGATFIKDDSKSFQFEGTGSLLFGQGSNKPVENKDNESDGEAEDSNSNITTNTGEEYDPYYEPIVPLPEAIDVKTGEEEEAIMFNERAKLYRYTNKEWKERGVGQMKILHHPVNGTYRLLMRREQVHKLVLNQLITFDLELQPMHTSNNAWLWAGCNYSEDGCQVEQLAVKFKNEQLAKQYYNTIQTVIDVLKTKSSQIVEQEEDDEEEEEEAVKHDEYYASDVSDEPSSLIFSKRCTLSYKEEPEWKVLGTGTIKIYYDSNLYGCRIEMCRDEEEEEEQQQLSSTIIGMSTVMEIDESACSCTWRAMEFLLEPAVPRTFRAQFNSNADAQEMYASYEESLQYAQQSNLLDILPD